MVDVVHDDGLYDGQTGGRARTVGSLDRGAGVSRFDRRIGT
jgi:hypothetical protein